MGDASMTQTELALVKQHIIDARVGCEFAKSGDCSLSKDAELLLNMVADVRRLREELKDAHEESGRLRAELMKR